MKKKFLFPVLIALSLFFSSCGYNKMVSLDEGVQAQWANVEDAYQRRADLVPNLVNTVRGAADFEKSTLEAVIDARSKATSVNIDPANLTPEAIEQFQTAQSGLNSALSRLLVTVERYPELKATANFLELQAQLEGTENRISVERKRFNDSAGSYNAYIRKFPQVIYSGMLGFESKGYFKAEVGAESAPDVSFDFK